MYSIIADEAILIGFCLAFTFCICLLLLGPGQRFDVDLGLVLLRFS